MRSSAKIFACLLAGIGTLTSQRAAALTVREAVARALQDNSTLNAVVEQHEQAQAAVSYAVRGLAPTVDAFGEAYTRKDTLARGSAFFDGDPYNDYRSGLRASFSLLRGGALWQGLGLARSGEELARLKLDIERRDLQTKVLRQFFLASLARRRAETYRGTQKLLQDVLGSARKRQRMGTERRSAVLQFETELALTLPKVEGAENELVLAATNLAQILNLREAESIELQGRLTEDVLRRLAQTIERKDAEVVKRPEIAQAETLVEAASYERGVLLADHWPSLTMKGEWAQNAVKASEIFDDTGRSWNFGLELKVPLFSGLTSLAKRRELAHRRAELELLQDASVNVYALQAAQNEKSLSLLGTRMKSTREALDLAREALRQARLDYDRGLSAYTQLYDAQKNLVEAQLQREQALYDYFSSIVQEYVVRSWPLDPLIETLEQSLQNRKDEDHA